MTYYLLENRNPHASGGFHGYSSRRSSARLLVIHTTENAFDTIGPDDGAENVAGYLSRTDRQASYHDIFDSDSHVRCLPHHYTAFGARGHNSHAIHMAFAGEASKWHTLSDGQVRRRLLRLAAVARVACAEHDIPLRRLVGSDARASNAHGICGHTDLDPDRRSDPGRGFPWSRFIQLLKEDDMPITDGDANKIVDTLLDRQLKYAEVPVWLALDRTYRTTHLVKRETAELLGRDANVDADGVAAAIADSLDDGLARAVADELNRRLAG